QIFFFAAANGFERDLPRLPAAVCDAKHDAAIDLVVEQLIDIAGGIKSGSVDCRQRLSRFDTGDVRGAELYYFRNLEPPAGLVFVPVKAQADTAGDGLGLLAVTNARMGRIQLADHQ